jgi:superfamily II DNA/RNA helicase
MWVSFRTVEAVVLDEADRMFDLGFIADVRFLLRRMPPREQRQGMLFSATLSHRVLELAYEHMNEPEKLTVEADSVTASRVRQLVYFPANEEKIPLLLNLLGKLDNHRSIVFINTKAMAERVTRSLERQGYRVATLSGDVPQAKRERLLARFQKGDIELLVATDVARARPAHSGGLACVQLRLAAGCRGLRAPHWPYRAPGCRGRCHQLCLRPLRDGLAGHRGLHRAEDSNRLRHCRPAGRASGARAQR